MNRENPPKTRSKRRPINRKLTKVLLLTPKGIHSVVKSPVTATKVTAIIRNFFLGSIFSGKCLTKKGQPCILPFTFQGEAKHGCVQRWSDTAKWCATKVDQNGAYINNDNSSWDYCDDSCPLAKEKDTFWDFN